MTSKFSKLMCVFVLFHIDNNKQIRHTFWFNIRIYSPRVNNFDINQKKAWNICFIICHQHQTEFGNIKASKTQHISVKISFFRKN